MPIMGKFGDLVELVCFPKFPLVDEISVRRVQCDLASSVRFMSGSDSLGKHLWIINCFFKRTLDRMKIRQYN